MRSKYLTLKESNDLFFTYLTYVTTSLLLLWQLTHPRAFVLLPLAVSEEREELQPGPYWSSKALRVT